MKVGILDCGPIPNLLLEIEGSYGQMIDRLLRLSSPEIESQVYVVHQGEFPEELAENDAYVCSGSRHSVYERLDWVAKLNSFVCQVAETDIPFVGICFGHQMIAEALGGKVKKSDKGWGIGVHEVDVLGDCAWMEPQVPSFKIVNIHHDQVAELPNGAEIWAQNSHCAVSGFVIGEQFLAIQGHPELASKYVDTYLDWRKEHLPEQVFCSAKDSIQLEPDRELFSSWITTFLQK